MKDFIVNMTPENFCYWLQGWLEIQNPAIANAEQLQEVKNHLALVFTKVTPLKPMVGGKTIELPAPYRIIGESPLDCTASFSSVAQPKELQGFVHQISC
jgi:hypothetical protein